MNYDMFNIKGERRERKLQKKKDRLRQHGKTLGKIYKDAILKRTKDVK